MTTTEWIDLWGDRILRQYFIDISKAFTRNPDFQEDLLQEAWLRVGTCKPGMQTEYYMHQGFMGMDACYHREWRQWRLTRWGKDYVHTRTAIADRLYRGRKKFTKHLTEMSQTRQ